MEHAFLRVRRLTLIEQSAQCKHFYSKDLDSSAAARKDMMLTSNQPPQVKGRPGGYRKVPLHGGGPSSSTAPYLRTQVQSKPLPPFVSQGGKGCNKTQICPGGTNSD